LNKKEKIRLIRILGLTAVILTGAVAFSYFEPNIKKPAEIIESAQKKIEKNDFGRIGLRILGIETKQETEEEEKDADEEKKEDQTISEIVKEKIKDAIIEKSSQEVIDILKTLPPEEFEKLKKEFCPNFCEQKSN